jgi:hypothetical protein
MLVVSGCGEYHMNENHRYTITPDAPAGCYRIFDQDERKYLEETHKLQVQAEAVAAEMNLMEEAGAPINPDEVEGDAFGPPGTPPPASATKGLVNPVATATTTATTTPEGSHLVDKRHQCVLDALAGKVVCSSCGKEYHGHNGSHAVGPAAAPVHSIKVTRYLGFDTEDLTVDINCVDCGHGGLYEFKGNPLMDAGLMPEDIPF